MKYLRTARRAMIALLVAPLFAAPSFAQDGYRTPPDAITKILDSPAPPVVSVSSDRKWLLITTADVPETSIAELAEPTLFLAGRRFQTQPRHRIDLEGVRTASLKPVEGGAEIPIPVPNGARLTAPQWSRDAKRLAETGYLVIIFLDELTTVPPTTQAAMLRLLTKWLEADGYAILRASDGRAAMETLNALTNWHVLDPAVE